MHSNVIQYHIQTMLTHHLSLTLMVTQKCHLLKLEPCMAGVEEAILHWSGKSFKHELYMCGKQNHLQNLKNLVYECTGPIVQSTISIQSMLMLGGSGGMPSQENFEK